RARLPDAEALALQPDGRIVVAGYRYDSFDGFAPVLARFRPDGRLDRSFGRGGVAAPKPGSEGKRRTLASSGGELQYVAIAPSGRIVAVGAQDEENGPFAPPLGMVIAYRPNGRVDPSFGRHGRVLFPDGPGRHFEYTALRSVKILRDGKILVAG